MASLLVYVEGDRLRELLPEPVEGDTWTITSTTFSYPQLERLDEHGALFIVSGSLESARCVAVLDQPRIENGVFAGGPARVFDHDITHLLARLGCVATRVSEWATPPRVLPPSDIDLLKYELRLLDGDETIPPVLTDDDRTTELRAAVWDDPLSDDARLVYADYLQDRGDPRGELVGIQVHRARTGAPVSDRERALVRRIGFECAKPLAPHLASDFQLARGFVSKCTVNDTPMPEAITWSPAWRTVDDLSTTNFDLLVSPHVRARRVGVGGRQLARIAEHGRPLPFETVVGIAPLARMQQGVWLEVPEWDQVMKIGALEEVRTLSVNPASGYGPNLIAAILRSPLGRQLRHLDAFVACDTPEGPRWRDAFDASRIPLLTFRFVPVAQERHRPTSIGTPVLVALRRTPRLPQILVQVEGVLTADLVTIVMRFVAPLSRAVQYAELHDFTVAPARVEERHTVLLERLRAMFPQLAVQPPSAQPLSP